MIKKKKLYYPSSDFKKNAWVKSKETYKKAKKDPVKFWEGLAKEVYWRKKWKKAFEHKPPFFKWFLGGKLNFSENCLDKNIETKKNKVALIWEPEPSDERPRYFTYYDLYRKVNKLANGLKKMGVKKGDRVGIYLPMIPEAVIAMLACTRIGAVHSVVFSAYSPQALQVRLQDTEEKILITADGYYRGGKIIDLKKNADEGVKDTKVKKLVVVKRAGNKVNMKKGRDVWWDDTISKEDDFCKPEVMDSEDPLFVLYTSGSTGKPKGIVHTCGGYTTQAKFTGKWIFDIKENDIFWSMSDIGWITGHTYSVYSPLLNGTTCIIFEGAPNWPVPDRWCQIIEKYAVNIFYTAPTAIRMFQKYGDDLVKKHDLSSLKVLGSVGEPIDKGSWLWYFEKVGNKKCPIVDTWWQTETGGILLSSLPGVGPIKPTFAGLPFPGIKFDILNNNGKSCKSGEKGDLVILPPFSPGLLRGVYKNTKRYKKTYWSEYGDEVYFTSDIAHKDKNGLIRIVGRSDDMIKVAGHRISTGEMEDTVSKIPSILECAVIGIPDEIKGEVPAVFEVLKGNWKKIEDLVVVEIKKGIGPIALPKKIYVVNDLPKTRSGKIMRRILRKIFTNEDLGDLSTLANPESVEELKKTLK